MNASDIAPVKLPPHLSSAILLQRPDIMEAEYQLKAADANIGAARRLFPVHFPDQRAFNRQHGVVQPVYAGSGMWNFIPKIEIPFLMRAGIRPT
jgi:Cu(I)/Ag(I) efflux system outer membrane protein